MSTKNTSTQGNIGLVLSGLIFVSISLIFLISLASFDANDPSYNNSTNNLPNNYIGSFGSHSSDLFLQLFGVGAYFIVLVPLIWGIQNITRYKGYSFFIKFISYIISIISFLSIISSFTPSKEWIFVSYGGSFGNLIYIFLTNLQLSYMFYIQLISFFIFFYFALGFKLSTWKNTILAIFSSIKYVLNKIFFTIKTIFKLFKLIINVILKLKPKKSLAGNDEFPLIDNNQNLIAEPNTSIAAKTSPAKTKASSIIKTQEKFNLPNSDLLNKVNLSKNKANFSKKLLEENAIELAKTLNDFGVKGEIIGVYPGPVVTLYELEPAAGIKSSRIIGLADDIARTMRATSARISVIPGKNSIGIELPNEAREIVYLRELIEDKNYTDANKKLPLILGKNISGQAVITDLASMPHLLVAGTTGSGKSVAINTMILSLLYKLTPEECKFIMVDPKMLELSVYDGIPHLLAPVVTEANKAVTALKWVVREMENRYRLMSNLSVRNIEGYNHKINEAKKKNIALERKVQTGFNPETGKPIYETIEIEKKPMPFIVVIVDEMADLMIVAGKEIEGSIQRLAQMARAAGIHLIMATQRPSVDVITGVIKANFPTRISFHVTSKVDSRTILGEMGAEQLLGKGDMLYMSGGSKIKRVHGPFVDDSEVENVVKFLKSQSTPEYSVDITEESDDNIINTASSNEVDELYQQAVELVIREQKASTSFLQRYFKIGYNRAATIIEQMEKNAIISPANHVGRREILVGRTNEK